MRRALMATLLLALPGAARAGDFTGAYVGLNAGYASGGEHDRRTDGPPVAVSRSAADGTAPGLPPSAAMAAGALKHAPPTGGGSAKR